MFTPRFAEEPVSAPKYAISYPQFFLLDEPVVLLLLLHAAAPATSATMATPPSARTSPCLKALNPPPSDGRAHWARRPYVKSRCQIAVPIWAGTLSHFDYHRK